MTIDRYTVLGLAPARTAWFGEVAAWATTGRLPVSFVMCVSVDELVARLGQGAAWSAVLIDGATPGLDRDVIEAARSNGTAALIVAGGAPRDWASLGAVAVLDAHLGAADLLMALADHATTVAPVDRLPASLDPSVPDPRRPATGVTAAVVGSGGTGTSTVAAALAAGLSPTRSTVLADLRAPGDQAMIHDVREVSPSIAELVDAHRLGTPGPHDVAAMTFEVGSHRLVVGLRRRRDWVLLRRRSLEAALDSLAATFDLVVVDVDCETDGEAETGSTDIEDRNLAARSTLSRADAVVVVIHPSVKGVHSGVRICTDLVAFGVATDQIVPIFNASPRRTRRRHELDSAFGTLISSSAAGAALASPAHIGVHRVDEAVHDGIGAPAKMSAEVAAAVGDHLELRDLGTATLGSAEPQPIAPGSLGDLIGVLDDDDEAVA